MMSPVITALICRKVGRSLSIERVDLASNVAVPPRWDPINSLQSVASE
jgi:hypothetical protein